MKFCYRLNLPPLNEVLLDFDRDILSMNNSRKPIYGGGTSSQFFKSHWLTFNDMKWCTVVIFYKPYGFKGRAHSDTVLSIPHPWGNKEINWTTAMPWAINWISGGAGTIEYWDHTVIPKPTVTPDANGYVIEDYEDAVKNIQPCETYIQTPGAYLVNGASPHRATGYNNRVCVSLRTLDNYQLSWQEIVGRFKTYIQ